MQIIVPSIHLIFKDVQAAVSLMLFSFCTGYPLLIE